MEPRKDVISAKFKFDASSYGAPFLCIPTDVQNMYIRLVYNAFNLCACYLGHTTCLGVFTLLWTSFDLGKSLSDRKLMGLYKALSPEITTTRSRADSYARCITAIPEQQPLCRCVLRAFVQCLVHRTRYRIHYNWQTSSVILSSQNVHGLSRIILNISRVQRHRDTSR